MVRAGAGCMRKREELKRSVEMLNAETQRALRDSEGASAYVLSGGAMLGFALRSGVVYR